MNGTYKAAEVSTPGVLRIAEVCQLFCVNDQVLFLGWVREGRGNIPSLAQRFRRTLRFHDAALSNAGMRSGHRIVKWLSAARQ